MRKIGVVGVVGLILVGAGLQAQTRVKADQVGIDQGDVWCPKPALEVMANRLDATLGKNWTAAKPCYLHFNLTPPTKVDPVSIASFSEPITIQVKAGFTGDDDVYVYAIAPTFAPNAQNSKIQLRVKSLASTACGQCTGGVLAENNATRMFPPNTLPIGMIAIRGGKFVPKADDILSHMQTYIGPGASMSVRYDQGGYWFQVDPTAAQQAQVTAAANALKATQALAVAKATAMRPVPEAEMQQLQTKMTVVEGQLNEIQQSIPPDAAARQMYMRNWEEQINGAQEAAFRVAEEARMRVEGEIGKILFNAITRVEPPANPSMNCETHSWAQDAKYIYRCLPALQPQAPGYWVRMPYDTKW